MAHHEKTSNDSTTKFAVIFALLFFFGVTVAGNHYFAGSEGGEAGAEHADSAEDAKAPLEKEDAAEPVQQKSPGRKKH
ncbi:MAG: hypothetical protein JWO78_1164 [Micavibrio sp.]|nr:hypothetical protein [Micavibrio sp.]